MNKTLEKIISKVAKPAAKVMLPLALTFGAYQGADAQTYGPKIQKYEINVVVEDEQSESLGVDEKVTYGPYGRWEKSTRHLDVLKVYQPSTGEHYSLLYMGDLSWNEGDTLKLDVAVHKPFSREWSDYELTEYYLGEDLVNATTPSRKRFHDGVITDVLDVKSGKQ
ncbi:hypothetical protein JXA48_03715 [Candidatus Woesearchaeota archaeon]|nr:hypothetical protein [Candidatus Woesearchaeota archaeon]